MTVGVTILTIFSSTYALAAVLAIPPSMEKAPAIIEALRTGAIVRVRASTNPWLRRLRRRRSQTLASSPSAIDPPSSAVGCRPRAALARVGTSSICRTRATRWPTC